MKSKLRLIARGTRAAASQAWRRPYLAGSVAFAAVLLGAGGLASGLGEASPAAAAASSADLDAVNMDSLLDARSPGSRGYGWLTSTKNARAARTPTERVLSSVRPRIPVGDIPDGTPSFGTPVASTDATPAGPAGLIDPVVPGDLVVGPVGPGVSGGISGPVGPGGSVPGGVLPPGSTPDDPTGSVPVDPTTPTAPAVPEPATWAMLVMGFAMMGRIMRRRQAYLLHGAL